MRPVNLLPPWTARRLTGRLERIAEDLEDIALDLSGLSGGGRHLRLYTLATARRVQEAADIIRIHGPAEGRED